MKHEKAGKAERAAHCDLPVPPGEYLREVLHERRMTQTDLARRMARPLQAINETAHGRKAITAKTALQLEQVLGVPAYIWAGLESEYRLTLARMGMRNVASPVRRRARPKAG